MIAWSIVNAFLRGSATIWLISCVLAIGLTVWVRQQYVASAHPLSRRFRRYRAMVVLLAGLLAGSGGVLVLSTAQSVGADGCSAGSPVRWDPDGGHEAWGAQPGEPIPFVVDIYPCETLMVVSNRISLPDRECDETVAPVCVGVWHPTHRATRVTVSGVTGGSTWWGAAWSATDVAIQDKLSDPDDGWFSLANCQTGCSEVAIFIYGDDNVPVGHEERRHP